jgi:hypothetical protein
MCVCVCMCVQYVCAHTRRWFSDALAVAIQNRLSHGGVIPRPFANLHIRYGEKVLEMVRK